MSSLCKLRLIPIWTVGHSTKGPLEMIWGSICCHFSSPEKIVAHINSYINQYLNNKERPKSMARVWLTITMVLMESNIDMSRCRYQIGSSVQLAKSPSWSGSRPFTACLRLDKAKKTHLKKARVELEPTWLVDTPKCRDQIVIEAFHHLAMDAKKRWQVIEMEAITHKTLWTATRWVGGRSVIFVFRLVLYLLHCLILYPIKAGCKGSWRGRSSNSFIAPFILFFYFYIFSWWILLLSFNFFKNNSCYL